MNTIRIVLACVLGALAPCVSRAADLSDGLISVWKLDEANGDAHDSHGLNKLIQGGTVGTATGKVYGTARSFERASAERFSIADNATLSGGSGVSFTMGAWVRFTTDPGAGTFMLIFSKDDFVGGEREFYLGWHGDTDKFHFQTWNADGSGGSASVATATTVTTNTWYFVQAGFDAASRQIWIRLNNSPPVTAPQTLIYDGAAAFRIGANSDATPQHGWNGEIGPAFFYKRYVSGGELAQHYNGFAGLTYDGYGVNVSHWLAKAAVTPSIPGVPKVDITHINGQTATVATTPIDANVTKFGGGSGVFSNGRPEVNATHISGDNVAADNAESFFDGSGFGPLLLRTIVDSQVESTEFSIFNLNSGTGARTSNAYRGCIALFKSGTDQSHRLITASSYSTGTGLVSITLEGAPDFGVDSGDVVEILSPGFLSSDRTAAADTKSRLPNAVPGTSGGLATLDSNLNVQADVEAIDDDTNASTNAEKFFDGTGYGPLVASTIVDGQNTATNFTIAALGGFSGNITGCTAIIRGTGTAVRRITSATDAGGGKVTITLDSSPGFTPQDGNVVDVLGL